MKAILRNRIFLEVDEQLKIKVIKALSYSVPMRGAMGVIRYVPHYDYRIINDRTITIPIGRVDLIPKSHEIIDKRIFNIVDFHINKDIKLRDSQKLIYESVDDNSIINAGCSFGKTFTALSLIEKLGQKTLVIVHTKKLLDQWVEETKKVLGIIPGTIGNGLYETEYDLVIGINKTITNKDDPKLYNEFGTIIVDECHHIAAKTINKIVDKFRARYKIGLSATLRRLDNKDFLITNYITNSNIYKPSIENSLKPTIIAVRCNIVLPSDPIWANRVNKLVDDTDYIGLIHELTNRSISAGHKVLTISGRLRFIQQIHSTTPNSGVAIGGLDNTKELKVGLEDGTIDCIVGSEKVMSEGVSFNQLSCLVLGQPISSDILLEQLIGRVIRIHEGKMKPIVYDIVLKGDSGRNQFNKRKSYYKKMGYKIIEVDM